MRHVIIEKFRIRGFWSVYQIFTCNICYICLKHLSRPLNFLLCVSSSSFVIFFFDDNSQLVIHAYLMTVAKKLVSLMEDILGCVNKEIQNVELYPKRPVDSKSGLWSPNMVTKRQILKIFFLLSILPQALPFSLIRKMKARKFHHCIRLFLFRKLHR